MAASIEKLPAQKAVRRRGKLNFRFIALEIDKTLFALIIILLAMGIIMMFSASYAAAQDEWDDGYYYVKNQTLCACLGLVAMFFASYLDYNFFNNTKIAYLFFTLSFLLCMYTSFYGIERANARRWIKIGVMFQPSEILKIAYIFVFAYILSVNHKKFEKSFKHCTLPFIAIMGLTALVLVLQRHMSALMLFVVIGVSMMFVSGMPKKHFWAFIGMGALAGVIGLAFLIVVKGGSFSYITDRIESWKDPMSDISDKTHQTYESLLAIGSGGWFGLGFGESRQKYLYLPESQNDFIFSIIVEELGFAGGLAVVLLFVVFVFKGLQIAANARDRFGTLVATGITVQISLQAFLNIMVATNGFPNTGISLPFFSAGGTALILQLCEMGVLLSISRQNLKSSTAKRIKAKDEARRAADEIEEKEAKKAKEKEKEKEKAEKAAKAAAARIEPDPDEGLEDRTRY